MEGAVPDLKSSNHDEVAPIELSEVLIGHNMHQSFEIEDAFNKIDQLDSAWGKDAAHKRFSEYKRLLQSEEEKGKSDGDTS